MPKNKPRKAKFHPATSVLDPVVARFTAAASFDGLLLQIARGYTPRIDIRGASRIVMEESRAAGMTEAASAHQAAAASAALEALCSTLTAHGFAYIDSDGNCRR